MDDDPYENGLDAELYASAAQTPMKRDDAGHESSGEDSYLGDLEREGTTEAFAEPTTNAAKRSLDTNGDIDSPKRQKIADAQPPSSWKRALTIADLPLLSLQHCLAYLNPIDLKACLNTCQVFRRCLTSPKSGNNPNRSGLSAIAGDDIWQAAWDRCADELPAPLEGVTAKRMTELLLHSHCENCFSKSKTPPTRGNFWNSGPGASGIRIIWQFQARLCGNCFETLTAKDVELIITPDKVLLPLLPFVFRTAEKHYISPSQLQSRSAAPSNLSIFKVYYRPSLGKARDTYEMFKQNFANALDGYMKDTAGAVKRKIEDAARWVKWEMSLPSGASAAKITREKLMLADNQPTYTDHMTHEYHDWQQPSQSFQNGTGLSTPSYGGTPQPSQQFALVHQSQSTPTHSYNRGGQRSDKEMKAAMAARKDELERRAAEDFNPPLYPIVLQHMPAFKAACLIGRPLSDAEWEGLKPRFQEQRLRAEQTEQSRLASVNSGDYVDLITQRVNRHRGEISHSQSNDNFQEKAQKPVRRKLLEIADRLIAERWGGCRRLYIHDVENFAADALLTTLDQFRLETEPNYYAMGHVVTLETMKHLFDNRVKPITDKYVRDLFACSECDDISKMYTFDGMMQHFGAKHDSDFGVGNVIVSWHTAEWPDYPPFKRHPIEARRVPPLYAESTWETKAPEPANKQDIPITLPDSSSIEALLRSLQQAPQVQTPPSTLTAVQNTFAHDANAAISSLDPSTPQPDQNTATRATTEDRQKSAEPSSQTKFNPKPSKEKDVTDHHPEHKSDNPWLLKYRPPPKQASVEEREEVGKATKEFFTVTGAVPDLDDSIRLKTIIHHTAERFIKRFDRPLDVGTFLQSLSTRSEMKPLKKWSGLHCHMCVLSVSDGGRIPVEELNPRTAARPYHLTNLLQHFKSDHVDGDDSVSPIAWLDQMIELPKEERCRTIVGLTGMNQDKLDLIAAALPSTMFPDGHPQIQYSTGKVSHDVYTPPAAAIGWPSTSSNLSTGGPAPPDLAALTSALVNPYQVNPYRQQFDDGYVSAGAASGKRKRQLLPYDNEETEMSMTEPGEDEYNPRQPMIFPASPPSPRRRSGGGRKDKSRDKDKHKQGPVRGGKKVRLRRNLPEDEVYAAGIPDVIRTEYIPGEHDREEGQISEEDDASEEADSPIPSPMLGRRTSAPASRRDITPDYPRARLPSPQQLFDRYGNPVTLGYAPPPPKHDRRAREADTGPVLPTSYEEYRRLLAQPPPEPAPPPPHTHSPYPPFNGFTQPLPISQQYRQPEPTYSPVPPPSAFQGYAPPPPPPVGYGQPPPSLSGAGLAYAHLQYAPPPLHQHQQYGPPSPFAQHARPVSQQGVPQEWGQVYRGQPQQDGRGGQRSGSGGYGGFGGYDSGGY
ncbi:hypothetical protein B9Z65_4147 [Elsinoe australis]|uniref:DUF7892 domain-containing protein n=1 Tax=Elsinoe australis TaxID=40998 RepID=A0A2P7Z1Z7_9PEZI|nr:hypothetical protein B9Z65_4147 [Elsinoe australis]